MSLLSFDIHNKKGIIILIIEAETGFSLPFTICSFVVAGTENSGFNVVFTALLVNAFIAGSFQVIHKNKGPLHVGFLIGCSFIMTFILLMTAIYWGQLANCEQVDDDITSYSCDQISAYQATSAFASLLFIIQIAFTTALIIWRQDIIEVIPSDSSTSRNPMIYNNLGSNPLEPKITSFSSPAISTDL